MTKTTSGMACKTRFAPSPSGHLHVGGARTALFCWAYARGHRGTFALRIEDTDQKRSSDAASVGFLRDLHWLGIKWDEGPEYWDCGGGALGPYFQSQRVHIYDAHLARLIAEGKAYYAFDTAEELDAKRQAARKAGRAYRYDRAALSLPPVEVEAKLAQGIPAVIRFKVPDGPVVIHDEVLGDATIPAGEIDDFVIRKADGFPTYHFAVVVDDELMECTHILRAQEHFNNTAKHMLLQDALGFRRPVYAHLPIIMNPDGSKMSKRDKDRTLRAAVTERKLSGPPAGTVSPERFASWLGDKNTQLNFEEANRLAETLNVALPEINVDDFRRSGYLPEVLCNFLALNGWSPGKDVEKFDNEFLCAQFNLDRVMKTPARFDRAKLLAFNLDAIQAMAHERYLTLLKRHAQEFHAEFLSHWNEAQFAMFAAMTHERSKTLDEPFRANRFLLVRDDELVFEDSKEVRKAMKDGRSHLAALLPLLAETGPFDPTSIEQTVKGYAERVAEGKLGKVAQPLRVAVSGSTISPPIFETLALLGQKSTLHRITRCLAHPFAEN